MNKSFQRKSLSSTIRLLVPSGIQLYSFAERIKMLVFFSLLLTSIVALQPPYGVSVTSISWLVVKD